MYQTIPNYKTYMINEYGEIVKLIGNKIKPIKPFIHKDGTKQVSLSEHGKVSKYTVHKLVAQTFIPNNLSYNVVTHKDGNLSNNHVSNLFWDSKQKRK